MSAAGEYNEDGTYKTSCLVGLEVAHTDNRGYIQMLLNIPTHNVSMITSTKGSVRSNHYHLKDWHYIYVLSGSLDYYYREHGKDLELQKFVAKQGDLIWTPPMEDHATVFLEDTDILALSYLPRDQEAYESDVRRIVLIDPKTLQSVV
jgi:quercetin dioxygenase-like cupin family protein